MSYIFSSNGNKYTFKKLDKMIINLPEEDGNHVLVRETVDSIPKYSWTDANIVIKVNDAYSFNYTPEKTRSFNNRFDFNLPVGKYLVTTNITCYIKNDNLFNDCASIEDVVKKGYYIKVNVGETTILNQPVIDTLNNLLTISDYNAVQTYDDSTFISVESNIPMLLMLGNVKSISCVFESYQSV